MRQLAKLSAYVLSFVARLIPAGIRRALFRAALLTDSRIGSPESALRRLFALESDIALLISERATAYGKGVNPKHRLTRYHDFFVSHISPGSRVLDLGCGIGEVARSIASRVPDAQVVGVDFDQAMIEQARLLPSPGNVSFLLGDATLGLPAGPWDVVVLSNVLEHIDLRIAFLREVAEKARPKRFLIRVPLFERDWRMPLRRELGVDFRSDPTHFIEHTMDEFDQELAGAGLKAVEKTTLWGEIWSVAEPLP